MGWEAHIMNLTVTDTECRVMMSALAQYRKQKGAEGKLREHAALMTGDRATREDRAANVAGQYRALMTIVTNLEAKLA
jgi:hypothetical protein